MQSMCLCWILGRPTIVYSSFMSTLHEIVAFFSWFPREPNCCSFHFLHTGNTLYRENQVWSMITLDFSTRFILPFLVSSYSLLSLTCTNAACRRLALLNKGSCKTLNWRTDGGDTGRECQLRRPNHSLPFIRYLNHLIVSGWHATGYHFWSCFRSSIWSIRATVLSISVNSTTSWHSLTCWFDDHNWVLSDANVHVPQSWFVKSQTEIAMKSPSKL